MRRKTLRTWWRLALPGQFNKRSKNYTMPTIPFQEWLRGKAKATGQTPTHIRGAIKSEIHYPQSKFL